MQKTQSGPIFSFILVHFYAMHYTKLGYQLFSLTYERKNWQKCRRSKDGFVPTKIPDLTPPLLISECAPANESPMHKITHKEKGIFSNLVKSSKLSY